MHAADLIRILKTAETRAEKGGKGEREMVIEELVMEMCGSVGAN